MNEKYIEVLPQYELEVLSVRRGRGAWICETDKGIKLLKEYKGTVKRLEFEEEIQKLTQDEMLKMNLRAEHYVRSREGQLITISEDGTRFCMKDWFLDRECNLKEEREVLNAVKGIASLHKILKQIEFKEEWNMGSSSGIRLSDEMERHSRELRKARNYISKKRKKSDFELKLIRGYEEYYNQAAEALEGMRNIEEENASGCMYLCHGELDQHHILMGDGYTALIEFGGMHLGFQTEDLYHFMRKVMEKHDWNLKLGISVIEVYENVMPLNQVEKKRLYYLFLYPEKYWKQVNFYYNANKAWISVKSVEKLQNLEQQQEKRNQFLTKII